MGLKQLSSSLLGSLPHGLQKRVDITRALASEPKLLLLDEPTAGMDQEETEEIATLLLEIKEQLGVTQLLAEHDMALGTDAFVVAGVLPEIAHETMQS